MANSTQETPRHPDMRVLICGNYGRQTDAIDGQTIKTRVLKEALVHALGDTVVSMLDTSSVVRNPLAFYADARKRFAQATHVIILPGRRGLRVVLPLFLRWRKKHGTDVRYVVVGGWLPELLATSRTLRHSCMRLDGIYVETRSMADRMRALGVANVSVLPNFRSFDRELRRDQAPPRRPLKLVFCARVIKEKGIEEAIAAVNRVNMGSTEPAASLDVYGPVPDSYMTRFGHLVETSPHTTYRGVLATADVSPALQQYDLLLFPTYYPGEGFPGTIIDAFVAGVPVLASDWKYNREIIDEAKTGAICRARSLDDLTDALGRYVAAPETLAAMRQHCIDRAREYHVDHALKGLLEDLATSRRPCS